MAGAGRTRTPVPECAGVRHAFSLVGELSLGSDRSPFVGGAAAGVPAGRARGVAARRRRRPFVRSRRGGSPFRLPTVRRGMFFQAEDGIRDDLVTGVQTCALPILPDSVLGEGGEPSRPIIEER